MKLLATLPLIMALAACMAPAKTPSLMPRAIERRGEAVDPVVPVPVAKSLDASLTAKIAALLAEATNGDAEFTKADGSGAGAIRAGRGAAAGSEAWILAEQARSALQAARQRSAAALGEIDSLLIAQAEAASIDPTVGGLSELRAAQAVAEAMVSRQNARLDDLSR